MAKTYNEIAKEFGLKIKLAAKEDKAKAAITPGGLRINQTRIYESLREIKRELDGFTDSTTNQHLSPQQKRKILDFLAEETGHPNGEVHQKAVEAASNDDLTDLIDYVEDLIK